MEVDEDKHIVLEPILEDILDLNFDKIMARPQVIQNDKPKAKYKEVNIEGHEIVYLRDLHQNQNELLEI